MNVTLKRSISPDGHIDSLSIEATVDENESVEETLTWIEGVALRFKKAALHTQGIKFVEHKDGIPIAPTPPPDGNGEDAPIGTRKVMEGTLLAVFDRTALETGPGEKPKFKPGSVQLSTGTYKTFDGRHIEAVKKVPIGSHFKATVEKTRFGWDLAK